MGVRECTITVLLLCFLSPSFLVGLMLKQKNRTFSAVSLTWEQMKRLRRFFCHFLDLGAAKVDSDSEAPSLGLDPDLEVSSELSV